MSNKFIDYNSSQIVPQYTLLRKFDKIIEYLKANPNQKVFYYNGTLAVGNLSTSNLKGDITYIEVGDIVIDSACNYSYVATLGTGLFTVGTITSFKGAKGDTGNTGAQGPQGPAGADGEDGVSITGVEEISDEVVGEDTLTTVRIYYSNETQDEIVITAKNGAKGDTGEQGPQGPIGPQGPAGSGVKLYAHTIQVSATDSGVIKIMVISTNGNAYTSKAALYQDYAYGKIMNIKVHSQGNQAFNDAIARSWAPVVGSMYLVYWNGSAMTQITINSISTDNVVEL